MKFMGSARLTRDLPVCHAHWKELTNTLPYQEFYVGSEDPCPYAWIANILPLWLSFQQPLFKVFRRLKEIIYLDWIFFLIDSRERCLVSFILQIIVALPNSFL